MKKSKEVPATFLATIAALALGGCGSNPSQVRRCVDGTGRILADSFCTGAGATGTYTTGTTSGGYNSRPHFMYGGSFSNGRLSGGSITPSSGADVVDGSGRVISRGGMGGSGSSSS